MPRENKERQDIIRVKHMIDACLEAMSFVKNKTRSDLQDNRQLSLSLIKEIEIIGEAATKISVTYKSKHSIIPWDIIVATRNRLIHGYFDIDLDIVWNAVQKDLPNLVKQLKKII